MTGWKRRRYVRRMMEAIDLARGAQSNTYVNVMSKSAGLRCIRHFEKVNGIAYDHGNWLHRITVADMARFGECIRKAKLVSARADAAVEALKTLADNPKRKVKEEMR